MKTSKKEIKAMIFGYGMMVALKLFCIFHLLLKNTFKLNCCSELNIRIIIKLLWPINLSNDDVKFQISEKSMLRVNIRQARHYSHNYLGRSVFLLSHNIGSITIGNEVL